GSSGSEPAPVGVQRGRQGCLGRLGGRTLRHHDDVEAVERGLVHTERFPDLALDTVANDRASRHSSGDGDAEAGRAGRSYGRDNEKAVPASVLRPLPYRLEIGRAPQATVAPETQSRRRPAYTVNRLRPLARRAL